jgi:CheY-like chemotaxis protein
MRLTQVLDNLLSNAAKYTDEYGSILISAEAGTLDGSNTPAVIIRVRDNGVGIPSPMLEQIFDLFTQANPSFDSSQSGLGIGLALVRSLINLHGGKVHAISEGTGKGSEFMVTLPMQAAPAHVTQSTPPPSANVESSSLRILVVDDNVDSTQGLALWLESAGHQVHLAYAGDTGLEMALANRPDAILLDIGLPGLNGYDVAQRLREREDFKAVPLIAMTGFSGKGDRQWAMQVGFDHYLVKPIDYEILVDVLTALTKSPLPVG